MATRTVDPAASVQGLMSFDPEYGETLVAEEDLESLTEQARAVVGDPARKADVYDLDQAIGQHENTWRMAHVRGPGGIVASLTERIG